MMMMMETSLSSSSSSARFRRVQQLAVPWASIVFSALVYAAVLLASSDDDDESSNSNTLNYYYYYEDHQQRALWEQDSNSIQPHHHAPVVNEFHKPLFPLDSSDIYGFVACTLGLMIAAGGGVGGGGILVPIYILIFGFSPKHAIPLSNVTVFGGAIANVLLNTQKRHPLADRPLVDWDLILVMEPLTIAGALIGAFLNKVLPETLLTFLLVALLTFTAHNTLTKATKMYKKETAQIKADKESELAKLAAKELDEDEEAEASLLKHAQERPVNDDYDDNEQQDVDGMQEALLEEDLKKELQAIIDQEREAPLINIKILVALFVVVLAVNLLKGGGAFPSPLGIKCGSTSFWMANIFMLAWILVISFFVRAYLVKKHHRKLTVGFEFLEGDMKWDARATLVYPIVCMAAGFCAGMFGIGGGIVKGPLMLAMGVHPAVSSASSACMILFTSFTATTSFLVFGLLLPDYAFTCIALGFVATYAGQVGLTYLMNKAGRNSYIAFSIGVVVALSAVLMTIQSLLAMAAGEKHHSGGICGKAD